MNLFISVKNLNRFAKFNSSIYQIESYFFIFYITWQICLALTGEFNLRFSLKDAHFFAYSFNCFPKKLLISIFLFLNHLNPNHSISHFIFDHFLSLIHPIVLSQKVLNLSFYFMLISTHQILELYSLK